MVTVIGAGPAGAMAAVRLARAGVPVTLFDPSHPREKPCGGGLTGRALALIADILDISTLPSVLVESARVESPSPPSDLGTQPTAEVSLRVRSHATLVVLSRAIFDRALVDAAIASGATLVTEKVTAVERRGARFVVRTPRRDHQADFILGADGANSL